MKQKMTEKEMKEKAVGKEEQEEDRTMTGQNQRRRRRRNDVSAGGHDNPGGSVQCYGTWRLHPGPGAIALTV